MSKRIIYTIPCPTRKRKVKIFVLASSTSGELPIFRHIFTSHLLVKKGNLYTIDAKQRKQINSRGHVDLSQFEKDLPDVKRKATK